MKKKLRHNLSSLISVFLFILALVIIHHKLKQYHYRDIVTELVQIPTGRLLIAVALTVLDYFVLTAYDALALRYIRHRLKYRNLSCCVVGIAYCVYARRITHNARRAWARLVIFCLLTYWLGFFAIGGIVFVLEHQDIPAALHLPLVSVQRIAFSVQPACHFLYAIRSTLPRC